MPGFGSCYVNTDTGLMTVDTTLVDPEQQESDWNAAIEFARSEGWAPIGDDPFRTVEGFDLYQLAPTAVAREIRIADENLTTKGESVS